MSGLKTYLGDGVYCDYDGYHIILTTENGVFGSTNTIYMEAQVIKALNHFIDQLSELRKP